MGFLARRTTPPVPTPSPGASLPAPATPDAAQQAARIRWHQSEQVGWNKLPEPARDALTRAGHTTGEPLAAGTWAPTTRRDPAGRYWRDTDAWWIEATQLLVVRAREALAHRGTGRDGRPRLRRGRGGHVQATTHQLSGPAPTGQRWSRPQSPPGSAGPSDPPGARLTERVIEVLPHAVQAELGPPTGQIAIRHYPAHGGYHDQVLAFRRISPTELIAVAAVREAGAYPDPDTAIDAADWHITTYRPQIGPPTSTELQM
ncbi:hypothetical protein Ae717Ps2_6285 [Pseudonocardia sp. Ae717_Ps2]|uniref:hypothetical protein n=1 Tax=Pseudonocardia sp. Ae717_Ps2 TaxID=1885573 RepID=UPI00094ADFE2|nr:hypothetical protein [Pseudonocardia sp. Ae717_Ps2]OLM28548.1 hypothetical protein Ae717Ps2_6144 [Pseudonocardia sp. Ae717_Ps2]OLM28689.1 hypothetical protein Ae717Ps2_6285 [Pseudonocardia sp. Ae717_Ps2]